MDEQKEDVDSTVIAKRTPSASMSQQTVDTQPTTCQSGEVTHGKDRTIEDHNGSDQSSRPVAIVFQTSDIKNVENRLEVVLNPKHDFGDPGKQIFNELSKSSLQSRSGQLTGLQIPEDGNNGNTLSNVPGHKPDIIFVTPLSYQLPPIGQLNARMPSIDPGASLQQSIIYTPSVRSASTPQPSITKIVSPASTQGPSMDMNSVRHASAPQPRINIPSIPSPFTQGQRLMTPSVRHPSTQGPRMNIQTVSVQGSRVKMVRPPKPHVLQTTAAMFPFAQPQLFTPSQLVPVPQTQWLCVQGAKRSLMVPQQYLSTSPMNIRPKLADNTAFKQIPAPGNEYVKVRLQGNRSGPEFVLIPKVCAPSSPPRPRKVAGPRDHSLLEAKPSAGQHQPGDEAVTLEAMDIELAAQSSDDRRKGMVSNMYGKHELNLHKKTGSSKDDQMSSSPALSNISGLPSKLSSGNMKLLGSLSAKNTAILSQYLKPSSDCSVPSTLPFSSTTTISSSTPKTGEVVDNTSLSEHRCEATPDASPEVRDKGIASCNSSNNTYSDVPTHSLSSSTVLFLDDDTPSKEQLVRSTAPNRKDHEHTTNIHSKSSIGVSKEQQIIDEVLPQSEIAQSKNENPEAASLNVMSNGIDINPEMYDDSDETPSRCFSSIDASHQEQSEIDSDEAYIGNRSNSQKAISMKDYKGPVDMYIYLPMSAFKKGAVTYLSINK